MYSKSFEIYLEGIDCANCAAKLEARIKKIPEIKDATLDFISSKLSFEPEGQYDYKDLIHKIEKVIKDTEPDVKLVNRQETDDEENEFSENVNKNRIIYLAISVILFLSALLLKEYVWLKYVLFMVSYLLCGYKVIVKAIKNIFKGRLFDENFLMSIATIGAFAVGEITEGVSVMLFYELGMLLQNLAVNKSRRSIEELMDIRPDYANLKTKDDIEKVSPNVVKEGDIIIIKPGEKVPLDGYVKSGNSTLDTSALTGESILKDVKQGDEILAGFINKSSMVEVVVTKTYTESAVSKILKMVQNASSKKAPTENFITKFARIYTPIVTLSALIVAVVPPIVINGATFSEWIYRALIFLVISCPCALVISIPLGFFGGIGCASKNGILVKGGNYLEALNNVQTVVFDKTGTLTKGVFRVVEIKSEKPYTKNDLLEYAAYAEAYSNHPLAMSIIKSYKKNINKNRISDFKELSGMGVTAKIDDIIVVVGNEYYLKQIGIKVNGLSIPGTVYIAIDGKFAGFLVVSDEIKPDSYNMIEKLKKLGIKKTIMLTGDNEKIANYVGKSIGIDEVYASLLPHQKVEKLESFEMAKNSRQKIVFIGDGINDAPVLAKADVGVAMGGLGSDAAIEAADVVIMTDEPSKIVEAINISKRTHIIVWENIILALGVKIIVLLMGTFGIATMWEAVFADVGVALIAVINSMRVLFSKPKV